MGAGLKDQWGVGNPAKAGSDQQSQQFQAGFQSEINAIGGHLEYTVANAEPARHQPLATRRDALYPEFQGALKQVDKDNPSKAQGKIAEVLDKAKTLNADAAKLHTESEKAKNDWDTRQPKFDEAVKHVEELETWDDQDPKAKALRGLVTGITKQVNEKKFAQASQTLDQFQPKLQPVYDEYVKQKEAKAQYETGLQALQDRLTKVSAGQHVKLQPKKDEAATAQKDMETSAQAKNYVQALKQLGDLAGKVEAYETALSELEKQKKAYEDAWNAKEFQDKLTRAEQSTFKKVEPQQKEIADAKPPIAELVQKEEYEQALQQVNGLNGKVETYLAAVDDLQKQKKQYEDTKATLKEKLDQAQKSEHKKLVPIQEEIAGVQKQMEGAAQEEDYVEALSRTNDLGTKLDAFATALTQLEQQKKKYEETSAEPKKKVADLQQSQHPKTAPLQDEMTKLQQQMVTAAQAEEYEQALSLLEDLSKKLGEYEAALKQLDQQKKQYDKAKADLKERLGEVSTSKSPELEPMQQEIATAQGQMEEAAKKEDYEQALALCKTLSTMVDSLKSSAANDVWMIKYDGKEYTGTLAELAVLRAKIATAIITQGLPPLKNRAEANEGWYKDLKAVKDEYVIIGAVVNAIGGADLGAVAAAVAAQKAPLEAVSAAINTDPKTAEDAFKKAVEALNATSKAISDYMDALDKGGNRTITALQVVEVVCFAVAAAAGAAILAPAGAGVLATAGANAAAGAGFGALQSLAENGAHNLIMTGEKPISPGEIVTNAAVAAVTNGAGAALGSVAGKQVGAMVIEKIVAKFAFKQAVTKLIVKDIVEGSLTNTVQTAVSKTPDLIRGKTTWEQFAVAVAEAFVVGGIAGAIIKKMDRNSPLFKNLKDEEIEAAFKEAKAGKKLPAGESGGGESGGPPNSEPPSSGTEGPYRRDAQGVWWTEPQTMAEQTAMRAAKSGEGTVVMRGPFGDPRYQAPGWVKKSVLFENNGSRRTWDGNKIEIHYMYNEITGEANQFKFLSRGTYERPKIEPKSDGDRP